MDPSRNQVMLSCSDEPKAPPKQFTFDGAYYLDSLTETIYTDVGFPLVESVSVKNSAKKIDLIE